MACTRCGVFRGDPTCGACLAASRIAGILESGQLPPSAERRVVLLLRGAAGELSDLVEGQGAAGGGSTRTASPSRGGTSGRTPGPGTEDSIKEEDRVSEYSYTEEGEEETIRSPDQEVTPGKGEPASGVEGTPKEEPAKVKPASGAQEVQVTGQQTSPGRTLHPNFNPHYLTRRLQLFPTGKASAKKVKREENRGSSPDRQAGRGGESGFKEGRSRDNPSHRRDGGGGSKRRGTERPPSPDRPPLVRRPELALQRKKERKKQKKQNKGQKRRQRGQEFREWRESRRAKKWTQ